MSWRKEKQEHPWATKAQAKQIATDHKRKQEHKRTPQKGGSPAIQAANRDFTGLYSGAKQIAAHARNP